MAESELGKGEFATMHGCMTTGPCALQHARTCIVGDNVNQPFQLQEGIHKLFRVLKHLHA